MVAKQFLAERIGECQIPPSDINPLINQYVLKKWQAEWIECQSNKLFEINPVPTLLNQDTT